MRTDITGCRSRRLRPTSANCSTRIMLSSPEQRKFRLDKRGALTAQCRQCEVRALCNGGCPKDRFALSRDGEPGHNYLCSRLELFFTRTRPAMQTMERLPAMKHLAPVQVDCGHAYRG